jgi:hypothetical protein
MVTGRFRRIRDFQAHCGEQRTDDPAHSGRQLIVGWRVVVAEAQRWCELAVPSHPTTSTSPQHEISSRRPSLFVVRDPHACTTAPRSCGVAVARWTAVGLRQDPLDARRSGR